MKDRIERGKYGVKNGWLVKRERGKEKLVANFYINITRRLRERTPDGIFESVEIMVHAPNKEYRVKMPLSVFQSSSLGKEIASQCDFMTILYGTGKDLRNAAMEFLEGRPVRVDEVFSDLGFSPDGKFYSRNVFVDGNGVFDREDQFFEAHACDYINNLGFRRATVEEVGRFCNHLVNTFLKLKNSSVMYPLVGHIVLAPFSSLIIRKNLQKPVLHLVGQSGSGKTFLGILAASFFGSFGDVFLTWNSTANSLEQIGHEAKDHLVLIDDYKSTDVHYKKLRRIVHGHGSSQGRSRMVASTAVSVSKGIRGLVLSTGEDFPCDYESIFTRVILIEVEAEINNQAGKECLRESDNYQIFMPCFLKWLLSKEKWENYFFDIVEEKRESLDDYLERVPDGSRIISNWALNSTGFTLFLEFLESVGVLGEDEKKGMLKKYEEIVKSHLVNQVEKLRNRRPVEVFFDVLATELSKGSIQILGLDFPREISEGRPEVVGKMMHSRGVIALFHRETFHLIRKYFRDIGEDLPFGINGLRDDLLGEKLLKRSSSKRVSTQVRNAGNRLQAWLFDATEFKRRCRIEEWEKENE